MKLLNITLDTELPLEEQDSEFDNIITYGDSIITTFYEGNYSYGLKELYKNNITANDLNDYIDNQAENYGVKREDLGYTNHFNINFFICLATELEQLRSKGL
jgi:hypothetical protein